MKKIILFSLVALSASLSYGQRKVDMATSMTSPTASSQVKDNTPFTINFTITNNGPDVIKPADSIIFYFGIGTTLYPTTQKVFHVTSDLAVSGTANFSVPNMSITGTNSGNLTICSHVILLNRVLPDTVRDNTLPINGNNSSCVTLHFTGAGFGDIRLGNGLSTSVYPNPATSEVKISFTSVSDENTSIEIYDLQGRVVRTIDNGMTASGDHSVNVDLTGFNKGVYIYKVISGSNVSTSKFVVE